MAGLPSPEPGLVIRYAYLWHEEFLAGREEASKDRPCAIIAAIEGERVLVLPITHRKPKNSTVAVEIPQPVKAHLGLDEEHSWILLSESNEFIWPGPDLRRANPDNGFAYGFLPPRLFEAIRKKFLAIKPVRVKRTS